MANLIVYYSRKGENYWAGSVKNLAKGNTERAAEYVQEAVGGDLFEIGKGLSITGNKAVQSQDKAAKWAKQFA